MNFNPFRIFKSNFRQSLKLDINQKIQMNKPAINVKSTIDAKYYLAFSPTNRKSLYQFSTIVKTGPIKNILKLNLNKSASAFDSKK